MKGILIVSVLFLAGAVANLVEADYANFYWGLIISGVLFLVYLFLRMQAAKAKSFIEWLHYNRDKILREGERYENIVVDKDTQLIQFYVCLSFVIFTTRIPTRYYIKEYDNTVLISLFCSLLTFIGGWWGLPWGPIYTIQVIIRNMTGGRKMTIAQFFGAVDHQDETIRQRYSVGRN